MLNFGGVIVGLVIFEAGFINQYQPLSPSLLAVQGSWSNATKDTRKDSNLEPPLSINKGSRRSS